MKLVAIRVDNNELEEIDIRDCPAVIDNCKMACVGVDDSPIFYEDSLVLFDEYNNICEGDDVYCDGIYQGFAIYSAGWKIHSPTGVATALSLTTHIYMKQRRNLETLRFINSIRNRGICCCVGNNEVSIKMLLTVNNGELIIVGRNNLKAYASEVHLATGLYTRRTNIPIYFGQSMNGGYISIDEDLDFCIVSENNKTKLMEDLYEQYGIDFDDN